MGTVWHGETGARKAEHKEVRNPDELMAMRYARGSTAAFPFGSTAVRTV